jgi:nitrate/TMAO reductase-like tetraheme cytochrome c subunit
VLTSGTAVVIGVIAAAVFGYRTWDYIEHDNDFCLSCHLMVEPYEQFAESAHRGLGCKACHKPDLISRSQMGLTQILENPDSLGVHAEVPNEKCESCHIEGDPETWRLIASSVGHRVHFESEDSVLEGLQCVECHSSSVHEFAATDQTCGQSGCHEDTRIRLGEMGNLTIHCVACHEFNRPAGAIADAGDAELQPGGAECLSCHAMRRLVGAMPVDEPHDGACGACHDPHEQTTPAEAVESCGAGGCHAAADTLTPMHRGLPEGTLPSCTLCHAAHDSELVEPACTACHVDPDARAVPPPPPGAGAARPITLLGRVLGALGPAPASAQEPRPRASGVRAPQEPATTPPRDDFTHGQHAEVACTRCHATEQTHGAVTVRTLADCRSCHHADPVAAQCAGCHPPVRLRGAMQLTRTLAMPIAEGPASARTVAFDHAQHGAEECGACHASGLARPATAAGCGDCHAPHHDPAVRCAACHTEAPQAAHPVEVVHVTCGGSGCHPSELFPATPPRTRTACLTCHQGLEDHEPGQRCGECHALSDGQHAALTTPRRSTAPR